MHALRLGIQDQLLPQGSSSIYSITVQWRIASNNIASGKFAYSTNGGSTWNVQGTSNLGSNGAYNTALTINGLSSGTSLSLAVLNASSANVTFGTGNGGTYSGYCGEGAPYTIIVNSSTTQYLNVADSSGVLTTC